MENEAGAGSVVQVRVAYPPTLSALKVSALHCTWMSCTLVHCYSAHHNIQCMCSAQKVKELCTVML